MQCVKFTYIQLNRFNRINNMCVLLVYNPIRMRIVVFSLSISPLYVRREWVLFQGGRHIAEPCFYSSLEWGDKEIQIWARDVIVEWHQGKALDYSPIAFVWMLNPIPFWRSSVNAENHLTKMVLVSVPFFFFLFLCIFWSKLWFYGFILNLYPCKKKINK